MGNYVELLKAAVANVQAGLQAMRRHIENGGMLNAGEIPGVMQFVDQIESAVVDLERLADRPEAVPAEAIPVVTSEEVRDAVDEHLAAVDAAAPVADSTPASVEPEAVAAEEVPKAVDG